MKVRAAAIAMAAMFAVAPAHGQQPSIEEQFLFDSQYCLTQSDDPGRYSAETIIASCTVALGRMEVIQPVTSHDANVGHAMRAAAHGAIAGSYARQDQHEAHL
jgi:hypothetical protein